LVILISCGPQKQKSKTPAVDPVTSLLGNKLLPPAESEIAIQRKDSLLDVALRAWKKDKSNLDNIIWVGRRQAYLWRYNDAIKTFTKGLKKFPDSPELYRHRGHRFLTIRQFDKAVNDLSKAAELAITRNLEIESDGIPNRLNRPISNLHFNIYYHLGLAYYLKGDFKLAKSAFQDCMTWSNNPDLFVASADWLYVIYRRLGDEAGAENLLASIPEDLELIENDSYNDRILMYKGKKTPEELLNLDKQATIEDQLALVTKGYSVGNWYLYNGDTLKALDVFDKMLLLDHWSAFGYLAAEAEIARLRHKRK
jgi:tetratricopeptide (TPR) repeat protein